MTKIAFSDFTFFFLSFFSGYITFYLFATVEALHPQACDISLVDKKHDSFVGIEAVFCFQKLAKIKDV